MQNTNTADTKTDQRTQFKAKQAIHMSSLNYSLLYFYLSYTMLHMTLDQKVDEHKFIHSFSIHIQLI